MYLNTDILFSTAGSICGREITQHLGILAKRALISANTDAETLAAMDTQYAALAGEMHKRAQDIGADAVVGVDFFMEQMQGNRLLLSLTGNAVRLKPVEEAGEAAEIIAEIPAEEQKVIETGAEEIPEEPAAEMIDPEPEEAPEEASAQVEETPDPDRYLPWKCHKCDTDNDWQFLYCPKCGEIRHFDWKCSACGQENPSEYKFCPGCGKTRTREEEHIIE